MPLARCILGLLLATLVAAPGAHAWTGSIATGTLTVTPAGSEVYRFSVTDVSGQFQITDNNANAFTGPLPAGCTQPLSHRLVCPQAGITTVAITGGAGNDQISDASSVYRLRADGGAGSDALTGGSGMDELLGGPGADTLSGGQDDDELSGGDGTDSLSGGDGHDTLTGGTGDDTLVGAEGNDTLTGDDGADAIDGGDGNDTADGGTGADTIDGRDGLDVLAGGDGNDTLTGGDGSDQIAGGVGADALIGGAGADALLGGDDRDTLDGGDADDTLSGGDGADTLTGGDGHDTLGGDAGDDTLQAGNGDDHADGGDGNDTLDLDFGNDHGVGGPGVDTLLGGAGHDELAGGDGPDSLTGEDGDDRLTGDSGDDLLNPGTGRDAVNGGDGLDTATYAARDEHLELSLDGLANDGTSGESDNLALDVESLASGGGDDVLLGNATSNALNGGPGDDVLRGGDGTDTLAGQDGDDTLDGGLGADTLTGGTGTDLITYANRANGVIVTLNRLADDGEPGEGDNAQAENVTGGSGPDVLADDPTAANEFDGGPGDDQLLSTGVATIADAVVCGPGADFTDVDGYDTYADDCERVHAAGRQVRPELPEPAPPIEPVVEPATLQLAATTLTTSGRRIDFGVRCTRPTTGSCQSRVGISIKWRGKQRGLGFVERTVPRTKTAQLPLTLPADVFKKFRKDRRLTLTLRVTVTQPDGTTAVQDLELRLRYKATKKRR